MNVSSKQTGMTLIDMMVGIVIGLLVSLAAYSTALFFSSRERMMVGGNGAMERALDGVFAIQRDAQAAGLGLMMNGAPVCTSINVYYNGQTVADGAAMSPVSITDGGSSTASDSVTFGFSNAVLGAAGTVVSAGMPTPSAELKTVSAGGIGIGDLVLVAAPDSSSPCTLMQTTQVQATGQGADIQHNSGSSAPWNPPNPLNVFTDAPAYPAGSLLFDLGSGFTWVNFSVKNDNLVMTDFMVNKSYVIANNIVQMKAWYGVSNGTTPAISQWVSATGAWAPPLNTLHIEALRAIRVVIVARAQQRVPPPVAGGTCDATNTAPTSWPGGPTLDLSANPNWQCYQYRTVSLVIPLSNVIFGTSS